MAAAPQDSELQHSFGPGEIGFDFLPLSDAAPRELPVPTEPAPPVPVFDLSGSGPLPDLSAASLRAAVVPATVEALSGSGRARSPNGRQRAAGEIWLAGEAILCACPDCRAPMSIRIWLMVADCWRCGTSIELSEEQEREVQRLLSEQAQTPPAARPAPQARPATSRPSPVVGSPPTADNARTLVPPPSAPAPLAPLRTPPSTRLSPIGDVARP
ncbi:MAG: hypothetical protein MUF06_22935, partial [Pirellulaceae bacterium]|nr:hypothetical protein [Pirellulaceae bacterium]